MVDNTYPPFGEDVAMFFERYAEIRSGRGGKEVNVLNPFARAQNFGELVAGFENLHPDRNSLEILETRFTSYEGVTPEMEAKDHPMSFIQSKSAIQVSLEKYPPLKPEES